MRLDLAERVYGLSPRVRGNHCHGLLVARPETVYPRVCGGTGQPFENEYRRNGLSPRVRGNLTRHWKETNITRSIPACAGEPRIEGSQGTLVAVYPRVCGGTLDEGVGG